MKSAIITRFGGPEELRIQEAPDPTPGDGELLIDVEVAGVNFLDLTQRSGASQVHRLQPPFVPGLEGVGRVRKVGRGVDPAAMGIDVGSRVAWIDVPGSYSDMILAPAQRVVPLPGHFEAAQGLLFQGVTAQYLVHEYRNVRSGDRVLVHAASGGLGQILVQWFKHLGAWVIGTVSTEEKAAAARRAGADEVVVYGETYDFLDEVKALTSGKGIHLAIDGLGMRTLMSTLATLARGGTAVAIGAASGPTPLVNPTVLTAGGCRLAGGSVFTYVADPKELRARAGQVLAGIEDGWLRPDAGTAYPLSGAGQAHGDLESRKAIGKLYLVPEDAD